MLSLENSAPKHSTTKIDKKGASSFLAFQFLHLWNLWTRVLVSQKHIHTVAFGKFQISAAPTKHPEYLLEGSGFGWWVHSFIHPQAAAWCQHGSIPREFVLEGAGGERIPVGERSFPKICTNETLANLKSCLISVSRASYCKGSQTWRDLDFKVCHGQRQSSNQNDSDAPFYKRIKRLVTKQTWVHVELPDCHHQHLQHPK